MSYTVRSVAIGVGSGVARPSRSIVVGLQVEPVLLLQQIRAHRQFFVQLFLPRKKQRLHGCIHALRPKGASKPEPEDNDRQGNQHHPFGTR